MNTIRRAETRDISRIHELLIQVEHVHYLGRPDLFRGPEPRTKYTDGELEEIIQNDETPVFVSVNEDDEVEGYAFCIVCLTKDDNILTDIRTVYIDDLCVDETKRGRHIGKELFEYVVGYAKRTGSYNVTLNVWSCNPDAMAFYEKCGLHPQKVGMEMILSREDNW